MLGFRVLILGVGSVPTFPCHSGRRLPESERRCHLGYVTSPYPLGPSHNNHVFWGSYSHETLLRFGGIYDNYVPWTLRGIVFARTLAKVFNEVLKATQVKGLGVLRLTPRGANQVRVSGLYTVWGFYRV